MVSRFSILFIYIFLFYLRRSCSGLSTTNLIHNIAVLHSEKGPFNNKTWSQQDTDIMLNITYLNGTNDSLTFYKMASNLYHLIEKYGVSLIISDNRHFRYGSIDILAGHLGIPVIKWFNDGLSSLPQERNTVLYLEPNPSSQLTVITQLLQHYGWNRVAIVSDNDYENVKMASSFRAMLEKNGLSELLLNFIIKPGDNSLAILVNIMKDIKFRAVVLLSQPVLTSTLLKKAKLDGLIHQECTWILAVMPETEVTDHNTFSMELPGEIIEIELTGRHHAFLSFDHFMGDSFAIFQKALKYPEKNNFSSQPLIEYVCHNDEVEQFGKYLSKKMKSVLINGHTGEVQFDSNGYRTDLKYDIIHKVAEDKTTDTKTIVIGQYASGSLNMFYKGWPPTKVATGSFRNIILKVSVIEQQPFVIINRNAKNQNQNCQKGLTCLSRDGKKYCCFGYCIDILKMLISDLDLAVRLHVVKDSRYGSKNSTTGQWSGLIGELVRGDADMALGDLTVSPERSKVVDFTESFIDTGIGILVKVHRHRDTNNLTGFSAPLTVTLWIAIIILIHVVLLCMWTLERLSPYGIRERRKLDKDLKYSFSLAETVWYTWSLIFPTFEFEMRPKSTGTRCVTVCFSFCFLILITSYTANLAAFLVVEREDYSLSDAGIKDPKLQNPPADFALATIKGTIPESFFRTSKDPLYGRIWKHMRHNGVNNVFEAIDQLLSGKIDAFVYDYITIAFEASKRRKCDLKVVGNSFFESSLGIALAKNSFLTSKISERLIYYKEFGIARKLRNTWFHGHCQRNKAPNVAQMSIQSMGGLFLAVGIGVVVATIDFFFRYCFFHFFNWRRYNISN